MRLKSVRQLENTRAKLLMLEEQYQSAMERPVTNAAAREATLCSLKRLITQLEEEIAEFEAHQATVR